MTRVPGLQQWLELHHLSTNSRERNLQILDRETPNIRDGETDSREKKTIFGRARGIGFRGHGERILVHEILVSSTCLYNVFGHPKFQIVSGEGGFFPFSFSEWRENCGFKLDELMNLLA